MDPGTTALSCLAQRGGEQLLDEEGTPSPPVTTV